MANILARASDWSGSFAWDGSGWTFEVAGSYSSGYIGNDMSASSLPGDTISGDYSFPGTDQADAYLLIYRGDGYELAYSAQLASQDGALGPVVGSFDIALSDAQESVRIGVFNDLDGYYPVYGYDEYGTLTIVPSAEPPPVVVRPRVISHVLRAYEVADTPVSAWIRGEAGAVDLSGSDLVFSVMTYRGRRVARYQATGSQAGEVVCTIPAEFGRKHGRGVYRFDVVDAAAGVVAIGILEVV